MSICISLNASEIASVIGKNIYNTVEERLVEVWKRNFAASYRKAKDKMGYKDKDEKAVSILEKVNLLSKLKSVDSKCDAKTESKKLEDMIEKTKLDDDEKEQAVSYVNGTLYKNYGILHEKEAVDKISGASTTKKTFVAEFSISEGVKFKIIGKIDALKDATRIIEIKNRIKGIPDNPPEYDVIQCQVYLKLTGAGVCELTEVLRSEEKEKVTEITLNDKEWKDILDGCTRFVNLLVKFEKDEEFHCKYLMGNYYERRELLKGFISKE